MGRLSKILKSAIVISMNKKHYSKFHIKDKVLQRELVRAHGMIILLAAALMVVLVLSSVYGVTFDPVMSFSAVFLLAVVGLLSLSVFMVLTKRR